MFTFFSNVKSIILFYVVYRNIQATLRNIIIFSTNLGALLLDSDYNARNGNNRKKINSINNDLYGSHWTSFYSCISFNEINNNR